MGDGSGSIVSSDMALDVRERLAVLEARLPS